MEVKQEITRSLLLVRRMGRVLINNGVNVVY